MAHGYRPVVRDQQFLLAPDMRDWLGPDHLVWTVLDVVAGLDTSAFHAGSRRGSVGRAGYDPDMLLGLLIYGYAVGVRSTRAIERLCATDVAFRIACAQDTPDHSTLARFRAGHEAAFVALFGQVLEVAAGLGLGQFGTVAIDGTKIPANASLDANRSRAWLTAQAAAIVAEAARIDAAEDAAEAVDPPSGPPPGWTDPRRRRARIEAAIAALDARPPGKDQRNKAAALARQEQALAEGRVPPGPRAGTAADRLRVAEAALARAQARQQAKIDAWQIRREQRQLCGPRPRPVDQAATVTRIQAQVQRLRAQAQAEAAAPPEPSPSDERARVNLTDPQSRMQNTRRGWIQGYNAQVAVTADQLIVACDLSADTNDVHQFEPMMNHAIAASETLSLSSGRDLTIGLLLTDAGYASDANLTTPGPDRLIALGKARNNGQLPGTTPDQPHTDSPARAAMARRLATPQAAALYKRRGATVEPAIGNLKKLLPRFSRRGQQAATAELNLAAAIFNLLKIHRLTPA